MADRLVVAEPGPLLEVLAQHFAQWSRNTLRQRLKMGCIDVNGAPASRHDHPVQPGDVIEILAKAGGRGHARSAARLPILFDDDDLIAIDKPPGLLSVSTDAERERTALALTRDAARRPGRPADLWPVPRLDREASGVLLFARSREVRNRVQADWANTQKVYLALVEGVPEPADGTIDQPLWEDDGLRVRVGAHPDAKAARTRYRTLECGRDASRLEVELDTGRKHQIRAHLAWLGHPIVGDPRYGSAGPRMGLHALRLTVVHPSRNEPVTFEAPPPPEFLALTR